MVTFILQDWIPSVAAIEKKNQFNNKDYNLYIPRSVVAVELSFLRP